MQRSVLLTLAALGGACLAACSGSGSGGAGSASSPAAQAMHTALPSNAKTPVSFDFTDVAVASGGSNALRVGFDIHNGSDDPLLCDSSEFYAQLSDGSVLAADASAEDSCDPDTVDPHSSGKATMYFNLPGSYTGPLTLMVVIDDKVVGQSSTTLR